MSLFSDSLLALSFGNLFQYFFLFFLLFICFIFFSFFLPFSLLQENENIAVRSRYNFNLSPSPHDNCSSPVDRSFVSANTIVIRGKLGQILSNPLTKTSFSFYPPAILSVTPPFHSAMILHTHSHTSINVYI